MGRKMTGLVCCALLWAGACSSTTEIKDDFYTNGPAAEVATPDLADDKGEGTDLVFEARAEVLEVLHPEVVAEVVPEVTDVGPDLEVHVLEVVEEVVEVVVEPPPVFCEHDCSYPEVKVNGEGRVMVVWSDHPGGPFDLMYACNEGGSWTASKAVNPAGKHQDFPRIAVGADGDFHMIWHQAMGANRQVRYARYTGDCQTGGWKDFARVDEGSSLNSCWPQLALDGGGKVHVTWAEDYQQIHYSNNVSGWLAQPVVVVDSPGEDSCHSDITVVDGNRPAIAWMEGSSPRLPSFSQEEPPGSGQFTAPFLLNDKFHGWPQIVTAPDNNLHVTYIFRHGEHDVVYRRRVNGDWKPSQPNVSPSEYDFFNMIIQEGMLYATFTRPVNDMQRIFYATGDPSLAPGDAWSAPVEVSAGGKHHVLSRVAVHGDTLHAVWLSINEFPEEDGGVGYTAVALP